MGSYEVGSSLDGVLECRVDSVGQRVGVVPTSCRHGVHVLAEVPHRAVVVGGEVTVTCSACVRANNPVHLWRLRINGPSPDRFEVGLDAGR